MPVIWNLIKESLKPVTRGANSGHAIALVLLLLLYFAVSICLFSKPAGAHCWCRSPVSKRRVPPSVNPYVFENKSLLFEKRPISLHYANSPCASVGAEGCWTSLKNSEILYSCKCWHKPDWTKQSFALPGNKWLVSPFVSFTLDDMRYSCERCTNCWNRLNVITN